MTANQQAYQKKRKRNTMINRNIRDHYRQAMANGQVLTLLGQTTGTNHNNRNCNTTRLVERLRADGKIAGTDDVVFIRGAHLMRGTEGWQWMIAKLSCG